MSRTSRLTASVGLASCLLLVALPHRGAFAAVPTTNPVPAEQAPTLTNTTVYYDYIDSNGRLTGNRITMPLSAPPLHLKRQAPGDNRFHIVVVGDGYTAAQMGTYANHATRVTTAFFSQEPFHTYQPLFDVNRIDVISQDSGVDNDPSLGIDRDTAMDMGFWCEGMERLLCINTTKAWTYASAAPKVDMIFAVANSTKYGGAGYPNLATVSGGNDASGGVAIHEGGHSLGGLADEYDYADGTTYTGPELSEPNVSKLNASQMAAAGTKWATWLGVSNPPFDSPVGCYEGAYYAQYGVFRPSGDSVMRTLGNPFNPPSAEALIIGIYRVVRPIDSSTPTTQTLTNTDIPFVSPVAPLGQPLAIQWKVDGVDIPGASQSTLRIASLHLSLGSHQLTAQVTDQTPWVRDETARSAWMRQTLSWNLVFTTGIPDLDGDRDVDQTDLTLFRACFTRPNAPHDGSLACQTADSDQDGDVDQTDFGIFQRCLGPYHVDADPNCVN